MDMRCLARLGVVVQGHANCAAVVTGVLPDDVAGAELPEASVVIAGHGDEVSGVSGEGTIPDPTLVVGKGRLEEQGAVVGVHRRSIGRRSESLLRSLGLISGRFTDAKEVSVLNGGIEDAQEVTVLVTCGLSGSRGSLSLVLLGALRSLSVIEVLDGDLGGGIFRVEIPHFGSVVSGAGGQVLDIRRQENAGEVILVGLEGADRNDASGFFILNHTPDIDIAL